MFKIGSGCFYFLKAHFSVWEICRFKLFLHMGINTVPKFLCMCNAVCMHIACVVIMMHTICEGLRHAIIQDIHNWIKDSELERRATMKQRASVCSRNEVSKKSGSRKSSLSSSKRSSKNDIALKEKLKMSA